MYVVSSVVQIVNLKDVLKNEVDGDVLQDMTPEEALDYMVQWMAELQKQILLLAKRIVAWRESGEAQEEAIKSVVKSLEGKAVRDSLIKDILKGEVGVDLFKKESDVVKRYAKGLEELTYVV